MSRYTVDKLLREVIQGDEALRAFAADAAKFVAGYNLTGMERAALVARDYTTLYKLGAHPFLLNAFVMCFCEPRERLARLSEYQATLAGLGYPDHST